MSEFLSSPKPTVSLEEKEEEEPCQPPEDTPTPTVCFPDPNQIDNEPEPEPEPHGSSTQNQVCEGNHKDKVEIECGTGKENETETEQEEGEITTNLSEENHSRSVSEQTDEDHTNNEIEQKQDTVSNKSEEKQLVRDEKKKGQIVVSDVNLLHTGICDWMDSNIDNCGRKTWHGSPFPVPVPNPKFPQLPSRRAFVPQKASDKYDIGNHCTHSHFSVFFLMPCFYKQQKTENATKITTATTTTMESKQTSCSLSFQTTKVRKEKSLAIHSSETTAPNGVQEKAQTIAVVVHSRDSLPVA